jgi:hypothetical protein
MEVNFSGIYKKNELLESLKIHSIRSKVEIIIRIIGITFVILAYIFYFTITTDIDLNTIFGITLPLIIIIYVFARPFVMPYEAISKLMKDKDVQGTISGFASNDVFVWKTSLSSSDTKWEVFKKAEIRENLVMLYQGNNSFFMIPKYFFKNETDWQNFITLVQSKL